MLLLLPTGKKTNPAFVISKLPGVLKLVGEGELELGQLSHLTLEFLHLTQEVGVLHGQLLLGGIEVVEGAVGFVELGLDLVGLVLELLVHLLGSSLEDEGNTGLFSPLTLSISVYLQQY